MLYHNQEVVRIVQSVDHPLFFYAEYARGYWRIYEIVSSKGYYIEWLEVFGSMGKAKEYLLNSGVFVSSHDRLRNNER